MLLFEYLAEQKIAEAERAGALSDLPGAGRPLALDDDRHVPEDLRAAYRILKNAGYVPPEVEARREATGLARLLATATDDGERTRLSARLALIETALEAQGRGGLTAVAGYQARLAARFAARR
jgi:hypothetical protein